MNKKTVLLLLCLGWGILFNLLFLYKAPGLSYPLFVLAFIGIYLYALAQSRHSLSQLRPAVWLGFAYIMLLSLSFALTANSFLLMLNALAVPALLVLHTTYAAAERGPTPRSISYWLSEGLDHLLIQTIRKLPVPFRLVRGLFPRREAGKGAGTFGKIAIGLLVSIPLLAIVLVLLGSADSVFGHWVGKVPNWLGKQSVPEGGFRLVAIAAVTIGGFCYLLGLFDPVRESENVPKEDLWGGFPPREKGSVDPVIAMTVLVLVNVVYVLFSAVQFSYFFGAGDGMLPDGTTYADYARRGFAELIVVSLINLGLLLGTFRWVPAAQGRTAGKVLKGLLSLLVGVTGVMLFSAFSRLTLYEEAYGYTASRILVHAFMLLLAVWLGLALYKIWRDKVVLGRLYLLTAAAAYLVLNYIGMEGLIVRENIQRYTTTGRIDVRYFQSLSSDAVPGLLKLRTLPIPQETVEETLNDFKTRLEKRDPWQSFNWSKARARRLLEGTK